jgi:succinoglycan biosynthesis protein ExoM
MSRVVVAIPTYRRPQGLERLLHALAGLRTKAELHILVADNDAERNEGVAAVTRINSDYRWPLEVISVPDRGIAQARNALLTHALDNYDADYIAMLDDDEWPEADWLEAFLAVARSTNADALHGAVLPDFETIPGRWSAACRELSPWRGKTGPVPMIHSTSNILLRRDVLATLDRPYFDCRFALSGGEDKEFFTRLAKVGATFAWADAAIVHAYVPASRSNPGWVLQRAFRIGNSDMRVFIKYEVSYLARALESAKIAAALALAPAAALLVAPVASRRMAPLCKFARAAGKLAAVFGARYDEYAVTHGR